MSMVSTLLRPSGTVLDYLRPAAPRGDSLKVDENSRFSQDFKTWLGKNGYKDLAAMDLPAFGGKSNAKDSFQKEPVIFIHGNQNTAASVDAVMPAFAEAGHEDFRSLYGITWYQGKPEDYEKSTHDAPTLILLRRFIQAVKEYTGAEKVHVATHSLGVTLGLGAIEGGLHHDGVNGGWHDLGDRLDYVRTFFGAGGANKGLGYCSIWEGESDLCNVDTGLHQQSRFIKRLAEAPKAADVVVSAFSETRDQVLQGDAKKTGPIKDEDFSLRTEDLDHWDSFFANGPAMAALTEGQDPREASPVRSFSSGVDAVGRQVESNRMVVDIMTTKLPAVMYKRWKEKNDEVVSSSFDSLRKFFFGSPNK